MSWRRLLGVPSNGLEIHKPFFVALSRMLCMTNTVTMKVHVTDNITAKVVMTDTVTIKVHMTDTNTTRVGMTDNVHHDGHD